MREIAEGRWLTAIYDTVSITQSIKEIITLAQVLLTSGLQTQGKGANRFYNYCLIELHCQRSENSCANSFDGLCIGVGISCS
jgi:hypothetical protein